MPLTQLAARVGQTPFYAYDRRLLDERVALLRRALPPAIALHYAVKANPMPALVQHMAGLVDGLDVASLGELKVALDSGMEPARISFAGPGKRPAELAAAIAAGIVINLESVRELETVARLGREQGRRPRVAVRVNPDFELKASGMKMGGGPKPFGVDAEQAPALLRRIGELGLDFQGLHIFSGSQNLRAAAIVEAHDRTFELALRLAADAPGPVRLLNIGGGFGIPYFPGDAPLDLQPIAAHLERWLPTGEGTAAGSTGGAGTGPLSGRRGGDLRRRSGGSEGLARPHISDHQRRFASSSGGLRQFRPGDPQELSGRGGQPGGRNRTGSGDGGRPAVHAAGYPGRPDGTGESRGR